MIIKNRIEPAYAASNAVTNRKGVFREESYAAQDAALSIEAEAYQAMQSFLAPLRTNVKNAKQGLTDAIDKDLEDLMENINTPAE